MEYELIDETILSETEVAEKYKQHVDKGSEFGKKLLDHITKNVKINDFEKAFNEMIALNLDIREDYVRILIDITPTSADQVRAILSPLKSMIKEDDIKKILAVVKKYS